MKKKSRHLVIGIAIIILSLAVLYFNLKIFKASFNRLWPSLFLLAAMALYLYYFSTRKRKNRLIFLFLATFIAPISVSLFFLTFTSISNMRYIWPVFILSLGLGMLSVYFYDGERKTLLMLSTILIAISFIIWIFYATKSEFGLLIGVALLIIGAAFLTRGIIRETPAIPGDEESIKPETSGSDEKQNPVES